MGDRWAGEGGGSVGDPLLPRFVAFCGQVVALSEGAHQPTISAICLRTSPVSTNVPRPSTPQTAAPSCLVGCAILSAYVGVLGCLVPRVQLSRSQVVSETPAGAIDPIRTSYSSSVG